MKITIKPVMVGCLCMASLQSAEAYQKSIDVIPMYNQEAIDQWGDDTVSEDLVRLRILQAVAITNKVYINSGLDIQVNPVGLRKVPLALNGNIQVFWSASREFPDGTVGILEQERRKIGADYLAFFSPYTGSNSGQGAQPGWRSITKHSALFSAVCAHEMSHNLNADHRLGMSFVGNDGKTYRTLMDNDGAGTRIWYLSNPLVTYQGVPLDSVWPDGTIEDNVQKMKDQAAMDSYWWSSLKPWTTPESTKWHIVNRETGKVMTRNWYQTDQQVTQDFDRSEKTENRFWGPYSDTLTYHEGMDPIRTWRFIKRELPAEDNFTYIQSARGDWRCLQVPNDANVNELSQPIMVAPRVQEPHGQFYLEQTDVGFYYIKNRQSNLFVHVPNQYPVDGEGLIQWWGGWRTKSQWYLRSE